MKTLDYKLNRRQLMTCLRHAAIALPFSRLMFEEQVFGMSPARRALFVYFPDGIIREAWHPSSTGELLEFPAMSSALALVKEDIIMLKGINYPIEGSHEAGAAYCLTGSKNSAQGISIDSYLGEKFKHKVSRPVVRLGVGANFQAGQAISFFAPGSPSAIEDNPAQAFYQIFGESQDPIDPATKAKILAAEKSILDTCKNDIRVLQNQLGSIEKQKLDSHLEALRELERRVQNEEDNGSSAKECSKRVDMRGLEFPQHETQYPPSPHRNEYFAKISDIMTDITVQVLACGASNVVYFQWSHPVSPTFFNFPGGPGLARGHHDISHYGDAQGAGGRDFIKAQSWYMERLAALIQKLKGIREGDQSLLQSMAIMACTEIADADRHDFKNVAIVLAGQAGGHWQTGRCVDAGGISHNRVLVSILQAMGLSEQSFGDPKLGSGAISELST
ncbi:MAG: DUF1552 domain-containing protein [Proteobacteria bacterium]|nr:DUF1552 domain-containing protein [Pseudomonadota bacterium]